MPDRRDPPPTDEGWYTLHDFRTIDWDAWREAPEHERQRALEEGVEFFQSALAVDDADEGASALYSILGHKADFLVLHLRPSTADTGALERRFEQTAFARFTEQATSFVSVTEASGYSEKARDYFTGDLDEGSGLYNYIQARLKPSIPDATHVCFYPMDKRRQPGQNWYDLSFDERAEHMEAHGDIGRDYGGKVQQMITGSIAIDDWEWGVTLWGEDLTDMKDLLYEMRFDPSTAQYADFGSFYVGRRFPPSDLSALLAGDPIPSEETDETAGKAPVHPADADPAGDHEGESGSAHPETTDGETAQGHGDAGSTGGAHPGSSAEGDHPHGETESEDITSLLTTLGFESGTDYDADDYGLVLYSDAEADDLSDELDGLRSNFEHYDSHVLSAVRGHGGRAAIVSIWDNEGAADTAHGFLTDLPGVTETVQGPLGESGNGSETTRAADDTDAEGIREELAELDVYAGQPHGEDIYALVLYSEADRDELVAEVDDLRDGFDRYDTHEGTEVYENVDGGRLGVVSLWDTESGADKAGDFLADLPGVVGWAGEGDGFGTMGMFYTVKPEYQEDFVETFGTIGEMLAGMDGHRETSLLANVDDENDMFIASQWDAKEDAMEFFRSDAFTDTVDWGRDVLADKPRHVFLA